MKKYLKLQGENKDQLWIRIFFGIYQKLISPMIHTLAASPSACRFEPSCSEYSKQAFQVYGFKTGTVLTLKRIGKCQPFSTGGFDPVPKKEINYGS